MDTGSIQKLENMLLVAVPRDLMDTDVLNLRRQVLQDIRRHGSRWVLLDFSRVDICDSFFGRFIQSTAQMAELMGAEVIISGLQDAVVETMIELGMTLSNLTAVLDIDDALAFSRTAHKRSNGAPHAANAEDFDALLDLDGGAVW
ncbi:MAG: STAS domain-containing protein [Anaerolineae bacterium]|nr:STAS domain-containing protein [Anaerolineae bacterium]